MSEAAGVVVRVEGDGEVATKPVAVVVVPLDRGVLDRAVHALDLDVGLKMAGLCQPMLNPLGVANHVEPIDAVPGLPAQLRDRT